MNYFLQNKIFVLIIFLVCNFYIFSQTTTDLVEAAKYWAAAKNAGFEDENFDLSLFYMSETIKFDPRIEQDYKSVAELYPGFFFVRGWLKFALEDYTGCIMDMNKCLEFNYKDSLNVYILKAKAKGLLEDKYGAIQEINKAIDLAPNGGYLYSIRGVFKSQLGDQTGACLDWSKAGDLGYFEAYDFIKKFCQ